MTNMLETVIKMDGSSGPSVTSDAARILTVDDDRTILLLLEHKLQHAGHEVVAVRSGEEALEILRADADKFDVVLLDRTMPGMNGIDVVKHLKTEGILARVPVIMQTGADSPEEIREGVEAGVFYYLAKPIKDELLFPILSVAVRDFRYRKWLIEKMGNRPVSDGPMNEANVNIRTLDDIEEIAPRLASCFPDREQAVCGIAELLTNALEHGNLGIGYDEKTDLIASGNWRQEIVRRQNLPEHAGKVISVDLIRDNGQLSVAIEDQGQGFDWRKFLDIDPARAADNHGRGIAQTRALSFHQMKYNDTGNRVVVSTVS